VRTSVTADVSVYGLAYLGVLLLFVGVFGLVAFSFADVRKTYRPVAEVAIPASVFAAAWLLSRRGPRLVSRMLVLVGGMMLPVVMVAGFVDGAPVPPDLAGTPLIVAVTSVLMALAGVYALVASKRPETALRYLVAPVAWVAVGMAALSAEPVIPHGQAIARPKPWELAAIAVAIMISVALARRLSPNRRQIVNWSAIPGLVVALALVATASSVSNWPTAPLVIAGFAAIVTIELLAAIFDPRLTAVVQVALLAASLFACAQSVSPAWIGAVGVAAYVLLAEWEGVRRPSVVATVGTLAGASATLAVALTSPWPAFAGSLAAAVWVQVRRQSRVPWLGAKLWLTVMAAGLPALPFAALWVATSSGTAFVAGASCVASLALLVRIRHLESDPYWKWWPFSVASALGAVAAYAGFAATSGSLLMIEDFTVTIGAIVTGLTALTFALSPGPPVLRAWAAIGAGSASTWMALVACGVPPDDRPVVFAIAGFALVTAGALRTLPLGGHIGLIGHVMGALALAAASSPTLLPVLAAFTAGWLVTLAMDESGGSAVVELLERAGRLGARGIQLGLTEGAPPWQRWARSAGRRAPCALPRLVSALSIPTLAVVAADRWGIVTLGTAWWPVVPSVVAIAYVGLSRWPLSRLAISATLPPVAVLLTVVAVLSSTTEPVATSTISLAIAALALIEKARMRVPYIWYGWALSAPLAVLVSDQIGLGGPDWFSAMFVWGAGAALLATASDELLNGARQPGQLVRSRWMWPPLLLGWAGFAVGLAGEFSEPAHVFGWWALAAAVIITAFAWRFHFEVLSTASWILCSVAYSALAPWQPATHPWSLVPLAAIMVFVAAGVDLGGFAAPDSPWLRRWDLPALWVGCAVGFVALGLTAKYGSLTATAAAEGAIALGVYGWRRRLAWLVAGNALVLVGAVAEGPAWVSLTLAALTAEATVAAVRSRGGLRVALQSLAAASLIGSAVEFGVSTGISTDVAVIASAFAGGSLVVALAMASRFGRLSRDWVATWAVPAGIALAGSAAALFAGTSHDRIPGLAVAAAYAAAASGAALSARPLGISVLRELTAVLSAVSGAAMLFAFGAGTGGIVIASTAVGLLATASAGVVQVRFRRKAWTRPLLILGAVSMTAGTVAAAKALPALAAHGWLSLVLAALSAEATIGALLTRKWTRAGFQVVAAASLVGSAVELGRWSAMSTGVAVATSAGVAAVVVVGFATACRWARIGLGWVATWTVPAAAALVVDATVLFAGRVDNRMLGLSVAAGYAAAALAAALMAEPLRVAVLREITALLAMVCGAAVLYSVSAGTGTAVIASTVAGLCVTAAVAPPRTRVLLGVWVRPLLLLGSGSAVSAVVAAGCGLPGRADAGWLSLALAAVTVEATVGAVLTRALMRSTYQSLAAAALVGSAIAFGVWTAMSAEAAVCVSALTAGVILAAMASAHRWAGVTLDWVATWCVPAAAVLVVDAIVLLTGGVPQRIAGLAVAAGYTAAAVAAALSAQPLRLPVLRDITAVLATVSAAAVLYALGAGTGAVVVTGTIVGVCSTAVLAFLAVRTGRTAWTRPLLILGSVSTGAAIVAATMALPQHAAHGWLSLVFAAVALEATIAALLTRDVERVAFQVLAAGTLVCAAVAFRIWTRMPMDQALAASAATAAVAMLVLSTANRWAGLGRDWVATFGLPAAGTLVVDAAVMFATGTQNWTVGLAVAGGFAAAGISTALAAGPLGLPWLREATALLISVSAAAVLYAHQAGAAAVVVTATAAGLVATAAISAIQLQAEDSVWVRPLLILGAVSTTAALVAAATQISDRELLAAALLAAGAEVGTLGVVFRRVEALIAAPVLVCASWITFAAQAVRGAAEWYTIPIGLALIAIDELLRQHERRLGHVPAPVPVITLEYAAMSFIVVSSLAQQIVKGPGYGLLAMLLGGMLALWGIVTHVRRRLFFGAGVVFLATVMIIVPPLVSAAPAVGGAGVWILVAVVGVIAMAAAAIIEQRRSRVRHLMTHFGRMLRGWE
jgi:hypothetical protein